MEIVQRIGVIGAGIMGSGIAQVAAQSQFEVTMMDIEERFLQQAFDSIKKSLQLMKDKGKITSEEQQEVLANIKGTTNMMEAGENAELIIEAVSEDMELKQKVFSDLDKICPSHTILASNTSSLSITKIGSATQRPDKVIGMHFSNPVPVMQGVEIIKGNETSDETTEIILDVSKKMGKETFIAKDFPGFAGNRLLPLFINEAFFVLWQGIATAEDIDKMCKILLRHPMGPFELVDFTGLDTILSILEYLHKEIDDKYRPCPLLKQLVQAGRLGRKSGRGVYDYRK